MAPESGLQKGAHDGSGRRSRLLLGALAAVAAGYLALWLLTATWGASDVRSHDLRRLRKGNSPLGQEIEFDAICPGRGNLMGDLSELCKVEPPWHFVGNCFAPCPFVVRVDSAIMRSRDMGAGFRVYYLWFFGKKSPLRGRTRWEHETFR